MLSYWEKNSFLNKDSICIIGSGIVGLSTAIFIKNKSPNQEVVILEKGVFPSGASSKNAGFACFGSASEVLDDFNTFGENEALKLVEKRWKGLGLLKSILSEDQLGLKNWGGYEIFTSKADDLDLFESCEVNLQNLNKKLTFIGDDVFKINKNKIDEFGFQKSKHIIENKYEAQIDTGKMITNLILKAQNLGVKILNGIQVDHIDDNVLTCDIGEYKFKKIVICTNGFAKKLLPKKDVKPARAQVLITKPIKNLKIKGTFHYDKGYYYFRNIDDRILLGGGRNLDISGETTSDLELTDLIQNKLEDLLKTVILPNTNYEIDMRWAGVMGVGNSKEIILEQLSPNSLCAVRLGGMGIAIGSLIGKEAAEMTLKLC